MSSNVTSFQATDPDFRTRIRSSFERQGAMTLFGAVLARIDAGAVEIHLPFRPDLTQQHGYFHGGIVTAIADTACGYAALSLSAPGFEVLSVEFKINLLRRASGSPRASPSAGAHPHRHPRRRLCRVERRIANDRCDASDHDDRSVKIVAARIMKKSAVKPS